MRFVTNVPCARRRKKSFGAFLLMGTPRAFLPRARKGQW